MAAQPDAGAVAGGQPGDRLPAPGRYRHKPVEIEAIQWTGENFGDVREFGSGAVGIGPVDGGALPLWVVKSSATCRVERGDWIIRERDGSGCYPCNADIFAATYEPAAGPGTSEDDQLVIAQHAIGQVILCALSAQEQGAGVDAAVVLGLLAAWTGIPVPEDRGSPRCPHVCGVCAAIEEARDA